MDIIDQKFIDNLEKINHEYDELVVLLESVEVMSDNKLFAYYLKRKKELEQVATSYKKYLKINLQINENIQFLKTETDEELKSEIMIENQKLNMEKLKIFDELKIQLTKKLNNEMQNVKIEITPKNGNEEFIDNIGSMLSLMFPKTEVLVNRSKTTTFTLYAENAYDKLNFLSGLIKVISFAKEYLYQIVVLKLEKAQLEIKEKDILVEISKSSGAGGQHINKTESAIKLIHLPTGISAECQDERSQIKNKIKAMENLKQKISQKMLENQQKNIENQRKLLKNAVFSSTPVLIFDFDLNKINDSRTKKQYNLKDILKGDTSLIQSDLKV